MFATFLDLEYFVVLGIPFLKDKKKNCRVTVLFFWLSGKMCEKLLLIYMEKS